MFEGIVLGSQFEKGRKSGSITIAYSEIILTDSGNKTYKLPLKNIAITQGGAGNRYVYFKHPNIPNITIYTDDKRILNHEEIKYDYQLKNSTTKIKNNRRVLWIASFSLIGIVIATLVSFYIFRVKIVEEIANTIPPSVEQSITEKLKQSILLNHKVIASPSIDSQLALITNPLVNAVEDKAFKFSFTIIQDSTLNAFALPGGTIMIHSGLIAKAKSAEEIAGVLAHEISHVTRRHHMRGIIGNLGMFTIVRGFLGDVTGISTDLLTIGATLESMKYSRDYERESDNSGFDLLLKAGISPNGMVSFFKTLDKEHRNLEISNFLSTHPAVKERIKDLEGRMQFIKDSGRKININFEQFQQQVQQLAK